MMKKLLLPLVAVVRLLLMVAWMAGYFHDKIEPGMAFEAQGAGGKVEHVIVEAVEGDTVRINANHPLAGVTLNFDVTVVAIREADESEIAHGHVH